MATLSVRRPRNMAAVFKPMLIEVDGHEVAQIKHGRSQLITVAKGEHTVQARMDGATSPLLSVTLAGNETLNLVTMIPWRALGPALKEGQGSNKSMIGTILLEVE